MTSRYSFKLFADYFQLVLQDEHVDGSLAEAWSAEATTRRLAVAPGVIGIGTVRNVTVPLEVEIHSTEPPPDLERWEAVVECSLDVPSGRVIVAGCSDYLPDAARVPVAPGAYFVRVSSAGLDTLSDDGLEGDDRYRVQLWPGGSIEPRILKGPAA